MKTLVLHLLVVIYAVSSSFASEAKKFELPDTIKLDSGVEYTEVKFISRTPSDIVFMHSQGAKNLKISQLPEELREQLNYSEESADAYDRKMKEKARKDFEDSRQERLRQETAAKLREHIANHTHTIRGRVHSVHPNGVLLRMTEASHKYYSGVRLSTKEVELLELKKYTKERPSREFGWLFIEGHPELATLADGELVDVNAYRDGTIKAGDITAKRYIFLTDFE